MEMAHGYLCSVAYVSFYDYAGHFGSVVCCKYAESSVCLLNHWPAWRPLPGHTGPGSQVSAAPSQFCVLYLGNGCGSISAKTNLICSICICHTIRRIVPSPAISLLFPLNFQPNNKWSVHFTSPCGIFFRPFLFIPLNLKPLVSKWAPHLESLMLMTIINPKWNLNNYRAGWMAHSGERQMNPSSESMIKEHCVFSLPIFIFIS